MAQVPIEELLKKCGSVYRLVILAAKRAKEIAEGAPSLVQTSTHKVTSVALEEILEGKVLYKATSEESMKKSRGKGRAEEKRKRTS